MTPGVAVRLVASAVAGTHDHAERTINLRHQDHVPDLQRHELTTVDQNNFVIRSQHRVRLCAS